MDTGLLLGVVIAAVVVLAVGVVLYAAGRVRDSRHTASLRRQFGSEYERVVQEHGDRRTGEAELSARLRRREQLTIRRLGPQEREQFSSAWKSTQANFVDSPRIGLREADLLVTQVMRERGYAVDQFQERAKLVSVDYPELVEHFRAAHRVVVANEEDRATTEELRQAMMDYRYLFDELIEGGDPDRTREV